MLLDAPALQLRYTLKDTLGVVERVLKERHWRKFDIESISLVYVPHWFFNFDVYEEAEGRAKSYASQMSLDATTGKLNPMIIQIIGNIPVRREREIRHGIEFEALRPSIQKEEVKSIAAIKIAGEMGIPKSAITISGVNLVYVPYWQVWARLPAGLKRIDLDAISGSPANISSVPERERGTMEVTMDMLQELTTPAGWIDYSKKAFDWGVGASASAGAGIMHELSSGVVPWMINTKMGRYTALLIIILLLLFYIFYIRG